MKKKKDFMLCIIFLIILNGFSFTGQSEKYPIHLKNSVTESYDLVIITPEIFREALQPLIDHKNDHNVRTFLKTTDEIYDEYTGRDEAERVKYFIKQAIESWEIDYVMLVGGKEEMPVRYSTIYFDDYKRDNFYHIFPGIFPINQGTKQFITDLYYADIYDENGSFCSWDSNNNGIFVEMNATTIIDDVNLYPDVCIGRVLCRTQSEIETMIQKIINYENHACNTEWFTNLIIVGGDEHANIFIENLLPIGFGTFGRTAWEGEYIGNTVAQCLPSFTAKKYYASGMLKPNAEPLTKENVNHAINSGAGFLLLTGHGSPSMIATHPPYNKQVWLPAPSGYTSSELQNLSNNEKLPVAVLCACSTGDFDTSPNPFAWELVKNTHGGAIASFAATTEANVMPSTLCTQTLLGHLVTGVFQTYAEKTDILGKIWQKTIENYLNDEEALLIGNPHLTYGLITIDSGIVWANHLNVEQWELFGDPSLKIGGYP